MDVASAFLNATLEYCVSFVTPPPRYEHLVPSGKSLR